MQLEEILKPGQRALKPKPDDIVVQHLTADVKDAPTNKPRVRMRVRNRCTRGLSMCGVSIPIGESEISVYKHEVPGILAQVEKDQHRIKDAREQYMRNIVAGLKDKLGVDFAGDVDELIGVIESGTADEHAMSVLRNILDENTSSVESVFNEMMKRDVRPLDFAEEIPNSDHLEPKAVEMVKDKDKLANAMGDALGDKLPAALEAVADRVLEKLLALQRGQGGGQGQQGGGQQRR